MKDSASAAEMDPAVMTGYKSHTAVPANNNTAAADKVLLSFSDKATKLEEANGFSEEYSGYNDSFTGLKLRRIQSVLQLI